MTLPTLPVPGSDRDAWGEKVNGALGVVASRVAAVVQALTGKADLVDGRVPLEQLPATLVQADSGSPAFDATLTRKGLILLAGDLGGSATTPTVPGLAGKADTDAVDSALADVDIALAAKASTTAVAAGLALKVALIGSQTLTGTQTLQPAEGTSPALRTRGVSGQSAPLQQWEDNVGGVRASVDGAGQASLFAAFINGGYLGGRLSVTPLTANEVAAIVRGAVGQIADLQQWQDSSGATRARISPDGDAYLGGSFINGGYAGARHSVVTAFPSEVGALVRGSVAQSSDLQVWQNSAGLTLAAIGAGGLANFPTILSQKVSLQDDANGMQAGGGFSPQVFGFHALVLRGGRASGAAPANQLVTGVGTAVINDVPSTIAFAIRGAASQTNNLQEWQTDGATAMSYISRRGEFENNTLAVAASDGGGGTGGVVLRSPSGTRYRITVSNAGALVVTAA